MRKYLEVMRLANLASHQYSPLVSFKLTDLIDKPLYLSNDQFSLPGAFHSVE